MGVMEAIRKGFGVATKNLALVAILIVFNLIWNLASIPFVRQGAGVGVTPQLTAGALIFSVIFILASIFIQGSSLGLVRDYIKEGGMKLANFAGYGLKYYLRLLGMGVLIVLILTVVGLVAALLVAVTTPLNSTVATVAAAVVALAIGGVGLYYIFLLILAPYLLVCDELGIIESMKRSIRVVRRAVGRTLLLLVLLILISFGIAFIVGLLTGLLTFAAPGAVGQVVIGIINSLFNGYLGVVMIASFMAFYLGLAGRERTSAQKIF